MKLQRGYLPKISGLPEETESRRKQSKANGQQNGMATLTLGAFLDLELAFKKRLNKYYAEVRDHTPDNGIRLLTYHLARDRGRLPVALDDLPKKTLEHARKTAFICDEPFDPQVEHGLPTSNPATVKGTELLEDAIRRQGKLASRYRFILTHSSDENVRAVLAALIQVKERDIGLMKKMQAMHYFDK